MSLDQYPKDLQLKKLEKRDLDDYEVLKNLGEGAFGLVKLCKHKKNGKYFAMKIIKKYDVIKLKQVDHLYNECQILTSVSHNFIVEMEGFIQDDKYVYIIMEFVVGGELFTYLRGVGRFDPPLAIFYAAQVTSIFEYLHSKNVIYRDLKPENLLIATDGYLKLADFGFAKILSGRTYTLCGTPEYLAPEILLNKGYGKAVDWWTLGVLIYEMIAGIDPFCDDDPMSIYQKILKGKVLFPRGFDNNAKSLVKHLLVQDLSKRYGNLKRAAEDIKNHRFFDNIDWKQLTTKKINASYKPKIKKPDDTSNFGEIDDNDFETYSIKPSEDPFLSW